MNFQIYQIFYFQKLIALMKRSSMVIKNNDTVEKILKNLRLK